MQHIMALLEFSRVVAALLASGPFRRNIFENLSLTKVLLLLRVERHISPEFFVGKLVLLGVLLHHLGLLFVLLTHTPMSHMSNFPPPAFLPPLPVTKQRRETIRVPWARHRTPTLCFSPRPHALPHLFP